MAAIKTGRLDSSGNEVVRQHARYEQAASRTQRRLFQRILKGMLERDIT